MLSIIHGRRLYDEVQSLKSCPYDRLQGPTALLSFSLWTLRAKLPNAKPSTPKPFKACKPQTSKRRALPAGRQSLHHGFGGSRIAPRWKVPAGYIEGFTVPTQVTTGFQDLGVEASSPIAIDRCVFSFCCFWVIIALIAITSLLPMTGCR